MLSGNPNGIMFLERKFYLKSEFNAKDLLSIIYKHAPFRQVYDYLDDYYKGKQDILYRTMSADKPNNKLVHNFPKLITDTTISYFVGKPITYVTENDKLSDALEEFSYLNHEDDINAELTKMVSKYGHAFELMRIDKEGKLRTHAVSPRNLIMCRGYDLDETPVCAIYYDTKKSVLLEDNIEETYVTVYTDTEIIDYVQRFNADTQDGHLLLLDRTPHYFKQVPVIEYINNEERQGVYENIMTLIDAYNLSTSDSVNDINYMNDAYLKIIGLEADASSIQDMKNNRVICIDNPQDGADVDWLVKNINDIHIENVKKRITEDIHKFSMTPNISDEKFASNLSGVAISYKLHSLESRVAVMERKFQKSLEKRLQILCTYLNYGGNSYKAEDIKIVFTRNVPQNLQELVQTVTSLQDLLPYEELVSILPFVHEDASKLKEKLDEQKKDEFDSMQSLFPKQDKPIESNKPKENEEETK